MSTTASSCAEPQTGSEFRQCSAQHETSTETTETNVFWDVAVGLHCMMGQFSGRGRAVRFCEWLGHQMSFIKNEKVFTTLPSVPAIHRPKTSLIPTTAAAPASPHSFSLQQSRTAQPAHLHSPPQQAMTGPPLSDLKQRLERKTTFEAAVKELTGAHSDSAALELVPRVYTLLKARHTSPAAWKAGLELFRAVQVRVWCCRSAWQDACMRRQAVQQGMVWRMHLKH